jgi:hypothetical protein
MIFTIFEQKQNKNYLNSNVISAGNTLKASVSILGFVVIATSDCD